MSLRASSAGVPPPSDGTPGPLRVLLVEDSLDDATLLRRELERGHLELVLSRVDNGRDLVAALEREPWDVVISDYVLPGFSGNEALRLVRERDPRLPFIVVSGTVGEDIAVRALIDGADDYLLKDRLTRLPLAIEQAIHRRSLESAYETASVHLEEKDLLSRAVLASLPALLSVLDGDGVIVAVNEVWLARSGEVPMAPEVGSNILHELVDHGDEFLPRGPRAARGIEDVLRGRRREFQIEMCWTDDARRERWFRLSAVPLRTRSGGAVLAQEDITDHVRARSRSDLAAAALASMAEAVVVLDDELVPLEWNEAFVRITGEAELPKKRGALRILREAMHPVGLEETLLDAARRRLTWTGQFGFRSADGRMVIARATLAPIVGQPGAPTRSVLVLDDVTELRTAQSRLEYVAFHDELTGLPNRVALKRRVDDSLRRLEGLGSAWLIVIDVNRLRLVNENLGHEVGDRLLQAVAQRMRTVAESHGPIARVSGDAFGLFLDHVGETEAVARQVIEAFKDPLDVEGRSLLATVSVGAACFPADGNDFESLLRCADIALQTAKKHHQFDYASFHVRMLGNVERNLWTSVELPKALRQGSLFLEFQPIMKVSDGSTAVVEALARWIHPERGRIGPGDFVAAADEVGLTRELGHYVLDHAASQVADWRRRQKIDVRIATNVSSALLLGTDFLAELDHILARNALAPGDLQLEITEGAIMVDFDLARETLRELSRRSIRVAIDDFGTGYSSLAYLRELRVDTIKIAKPFVDRLPGASEDRLIVEAIVHLARALGMRTVAEGVEEEVQLRALAELGCDEVQGYFIARPMGAAAFPSWLAGRSEAPSDIRAL